MHTWLLLYSESCHIATINVFHVFSYYHGYWYKIFNIYVAGVTDILANIITKAICTRNLVTTEIVT